MATARKFTRFVTYAFLLSLTAMLSFFIGGKKADRSESLLANLTPPTAHADNPGASGCATDTGASGCTGSGDGGGGADGGSGCADCGGGDCGGAGNGP